MFHVEPEVLFCIAVFLEHSNNNSLLKTRRNLTLADLEPWNKMLSDYGEMLHSQRVSIVGAMEPIFSWRFKNLLPNLEIELEYNPGFHTEQGLLQDLFNSIKKIWIAVIRVWSASCWFTVKNTFGNADDVLSLVGKKSC